MEGKGLPHARDPDLVALNLDDPTAFRERQGDGSHKAITVVTWPDNSDEGLDDGNRRLAADGKLQQVRRPALDAWLRSERRIVHGTNLVFIKAGEVRRNKEPVLRKQQVLTLPIPTIRFLIWLPG